MWRVEVHLGPDWHNARRINGRVTEVIVMLDMVHVDGLCHIFVLIEFTGISPQVGIIFQTADIALEVTYVYRVEPDKRSEQPPVGLGQHVT